MALSGADYAMIAGLLAAFCGLPMTLSIFAIRALAKRVDIVETRVYERIDGVEGRVDKVAASRVEKLDYLRETVSSRKKMDRMSEQLSTIGARLESEFGLSAALKQLAEAVKSTHTDG